MVISNTLKVAFQWSHGGMFEKPSSTELLARCFGGGGEDTENSPDWQPDLAVACFCKLTVEMMDFLLPFNSRRVDIHNCLVCRGLSKEPQELNYQPARWLVLGRGSRKSRRDPDRMEPGRGGGCGSSSGNELRRQAPVRSGRATGHSKDCILFLSALRRPLWAVSCCWWCDLIWFVFLKIIIKWLRW